MCSIYCQLLSSIVTCEPVDYPAPHAEQLRSREYHLVTHDSQSSHVAESSRIARNEFYEDQDQGREYIPDYEVAYDEDFGTMYNGGHDDEHFRQGSSSRGYYDRGY